MKTRIINIALASIYFVSLSCCKSPASGDLEHLNLYGYQETSANIYFREIKEPITIIQLDTSSKFRVSNIDKVIISKGRAFLLDKTKKKLVSYDLGSGKPVCLYGRKGRAGNEYLQITGFDVDSHGNIWILDSQGDKLLKYNRDGHYISKVDMSFDAIDVKCVDDDKFLLAVLPSGKMSKSKDRIILCDNELNNKISILLYENNFDINTVLSTSSFSFYEDGSLLCNNLYIDDNVYKIDFSGKVQREYYIDFGKMSFPINYRKDITAHQNDIENYRCVCPPIKITDSYCIGNMFNKGLCSFFIADRKEKKLYVSDVETPYCLVGFDSENALFFSAESEKLFALHL